MPRSLRYLTASLGVCGALLCVPAAAQNTPQTAPATPGAAFETVPLDDAAANGALPDGAVEGLNQGAANAKAFAEAIVLAVRGEDITLSVGSNNGVAVGSTYALIAAPTNAAPGTEQPPTPNPNPAFNPGAALPTGADTDAAGGVLIRLRVVAVRPTESTARVIQTTRNAMLTVGDSLRPLPAAPNEPINPTPAIPIPAPIPAPAVPGSAPLAPGSAPLAPPNVAQPPLAQPPLAQPQTGAMGAGRGGQNTGSAMAVGRVPGSATAPSAGAATVPGAANAPSLEGFDLPGSGSAEPRNRVAVRPNKSADYLAALAAAALVLNTRRDTAQSLDRRVVGEQQFSAISPFPGGGYSVLPNGEIAPGGAMQINIPLAYTPQRPAFVIGAYALQNRRGDSLATSAGRNGTFNIGGGFGLKGLGARRGVWLSRIGIATFNVFGGERAFNALVQLSGETSRLPALAAGIQDFTNSREYSPFIVATKQIDLGGGKRASLDTIALDGAPSAALPSAALLPSGRPLYLSLGVGRGRFVGDSIFGGVSLPLGRANLAVEYDGIQINTGLSFALTRYFTLLASLNDLSQSDNRAVGKLGRRYQVGGSLNF